VGHRLGLATRTRSVSVSGQLASDDDGGTDLEHVQRGVDDVVGAESSVPWLSESVEFTVRPLRPDQHRRLAVVHRPSALPSHTRLVSSQLPTNLHYSRLSVKTFISLMISLCVINMNVADCAEGWL